jgi:hypothetical protein
MNFLRTVKDAIPSDSNDSSNVSKGRLHAALLLFSTTVMTTDLFNNTLQS